MHVCIYIICNTYYDISYLLVFVNMIINICYDIVCISRLTDCYTLMRYTNYYMFALTHTLLVILYYIITTPAGQV